MTVHVDRQNTPKLEAAFWRYHEAHPETYAEIVRVARRLKRQGWERFGIATVFEVVRYRGALRGPRGGGPKLNNNHRAFYARLVNEREPDLKSFFTTRKQGVPSHLAP